MSGINHQLTFSSVLQEYTFSEKRFDQEFKSFAQITYDESRYLQMVIDHAVSCLPFEVLLTHTV